MTINIRDGKLFRPQTSAAAATTLRNRGSGFSFTRNVVHNRTLRGPVGAVQRRLLGRGESGA